VSHKKQGLKIQHEFLAMAKELRAKGIRIDDGLTRAQSAGETELV